MPTIWKANQRLLSNHTERLRLPIVNHGLHQIKIDAYWYHGTFLLEQDTEPRTQYGISRRPEQGLYIKFQGTTKVAISI